MGFEKLDGVPQKRQEMVREHLGLANPLEESNNCRGAGVRYKSAPWERSESDGPCVAHAEYYRAHERNVREGSQQQ